MAKSLKLEIVTPFSKVFAGEIATLVAPGSEGYFGVLPGHTPMLAALGIGYLKIQQQGEDRYYAISGGYAEVGPGHVVVLAETAEPATQIDVDRAQQAKTRAEQRLQAGRKDWDLERARAALHRSLNRLKVAELRLH